MLIEVGEDLAEVLVEVLALAAAGAGLATAVMVKSEIKRGEERILLGGEVLL
ncbi:hypothetical protein K402DRAFT_394086 [Aulographum hederae CBS 113979]|uniref:Uncharacterized protein n=1 Tax=Aulographum hederae CBS 113979 TaxID=1176131 RepID=A0A6G1GZQ0_9PEZI|nr:hypothetical protein K402DRAFT_394086 [Aulographum hederae CBS 113979]